ncbi:MAG TPA: gamma-glutamyl-gamma-aminobutyrate hydrolase family protein [Pyrinomonadaceae bacterium]|jgi:putative glutamine amidotransferase
MTKAPVIGITVSIDHGKVIRKNHDYFYVKRAYTEAVRRAGGRPVLITPDLDPEAVAELCDSIVISGGDDLPPELYGEQVLSLLNLESEERIGWERRLLDIFHGSGRPILGVCYGMQLINVHFGGSLLQDINDARPDGAVNHGGAGKVTSHRVKINDGSFLYGVLGPEATVSSNHHQAIKRLAPNFTVAAMSEDGLVEAIQWKNTFAVEWHPESDETRHAVYSYLVDASEGSEGG